MKITELAWAAGFFDGEGWVGAVNTSKTSEGIRAYVTQKDRQALDRFRNAVGFGTIAGPYSVKYPVHYWRVSSEANVKKLHELLKPFLCSPKRTQFETAIAKFDNRPTKRRASH